MATVPTITLNDHHEIPQFGFGVWQVSEEDIVASVRTALETGYRHIDTAAVYGNEGGVGQAIKESGIPRDELFITTKLWNTRHQDAPAALAESLEKLGLDHVDLYLIHWPSPQENHYVEAWQAMEQLKAEGLTTSIGVSNFNAEHLDRLAAECDTIPAVNQIEVHPTFLQREQVADNARRTIMTEAWSPLGQSQDLDAKPIVKIAEELGRTPAQVILRWHLQRGLIVFPKSITPERIESNFQVFDFELSTEQVADIEQLDAGNRIGPDPAEFGIPQ